MLCHPYVKNLLVLHYIIIVKTITENCLFILLVAASFLPSFVSLLIISDSWMMDGVNS